MMCAAVNPNDKYLDALLVSGMGMPVPDFNGRNLLHYASACETDAPLQLLIRKGLAYFAPDDTQTTALMIAARYGRVANTKLILQHNAWMLAQKNK